MPRKRLTRRLQTILAAALTFLPAIADAQQADRARLHALAAQNANLKTGPEVGAKIPAFDLVDQNGKHQTFESLRGPKGLVLAFVRSADW